MKLKNTIKSIAIGSFDGIHIAHKKLIDEVDALVIIERNGGYLTPGYKRSFFTSKVCCFYHFETIKSLTPKAFIEKLKVDFPLLETIVVGYDFHFGKNKSGNIALLETLFDKKIHIVKEVCLKKIPVHSRTIKAYLREGNIDMANKLLGRPYSIEGEVIKGQGLGKKELVPTLNLKVKKYQLPKDGVYATRTKIDDIWLNSITFLGHRITTDKSFAVETHIINHELNEINGNVQIEFLAYLRDNQKFTNLTTLKLQIKDDIHSIEKS